MMLRHNLRTDAQICGKSATQASLFVRHGHGVNRVYYGILNRLHIYHCVASFIPLGKGIG